MASLAQSMIRVKFGDTDSTGRVYFTSYIRWIDDAIIEYLRQRGLAYTGRGVMLMDGTPHENAFVIGEYHCRIERPSAYDDPIRLQIRVREITQRTVVFECKMFDAKGDSLLASGYITYVYVNPKKLKSTDIPEDLAIRIRA